jgi:hypothetical protein
MNERIRTQVTAACRCLDNEITDCLQSNETNSSSVAPKNKLSAAVKINT